MADKSNAIVVENYQIAPNTTVGITASPGQYALGVKIIGGTAAITNLGGSYGNGYWLDTGTLGVNTAGTFYIAASGSTAVIQVVKTIQSFTLFAGQI